VWGSKWVCVRVWLWFRRMDYISWRGIFFSNHPEITIVCSYLPWHRLLCNIRPPTLESRSYKYEGVKDMHVDF